MAETIDEARIIAWIDRELTPEEATIVAAQVAQDPALTQLAAKHRRMKARFAAAFGAIAVEAVSQPAPSAEVISLAAVRAARAPQPDAHARRWAWPLSLAASLVVGVAVGHQSSVWSVGDHANALTIDRTIATALDTQLSGDEGSVRVALSFRDKGGAFCRSFAGAGLSGMACRKGNGWSLRYAERGSSVQGEYRMAGGDGALMAAVSGTIAGEPLNRQEEIAARRAAWR